MRKGSKQTAEAKMKMSLSKKGHPGYWKGKHLTAETKLKMSNAALGRTLSYKTRLKISKSHLGEKSYSWKGGISKLHKTERQQDMQTFAYREWRKSVFERDNYICVECGAKNGDGKRVVLNADHLKPYALFPDLRLDINNGRTLCVPCHHNTPTFGYNINIYG